MERFEIANKVAIVTGGASGIGLQCVVELLENGAKAVTVADIAPDNGKPLLEKFGKRVKFVKTDVSDYDSFERAFKDTVEEFGNVDILINSAGTFNDNKWHKAVAINVNGVIHGMVLGLENYIPKYKSDSEGVIVNVSSLAGINPFESIPIYTGTKFAIHGMTLAWGSSNHFERTNVRVMGVCPGVTETPLLHLPKENYINPAYHKLAKCIEHLMVAPQSPEHVAQQIIRVIEQAPNGTMWVIEEGGVPYQYKMTNGQNMENKLL